MKVTPQAAHNHGSELILEAEPQLIIQRWEPAEAPLPLLFIIHIHLNRAVRVTWTGSGPNGGQVKSRA